MLKTKKIAFKDLVKRIALIVVLVPIGCVFLYFRFGGLGSSNSTSDLTPEQQTQITELKSSIDSLDNQYKICDQQLSTDKNNLDQVESQMNLYQYNNTYQYNLLVPKQNSLVNTYNNKLAECQNLSAQHDSKVDSYNKLIKK